MVKDDASVRSVKDLKGGTAGVLGFKTATDLWVRAALLAAGLVPDRDVKVAPIAFPAMGVAVRSDKVNLGTFVEPFYSAETAKGGLRTLFTAVKAVGYDHELLDVWFGEKFLKAQPDAVRAFLADYVAVTRYYLANTAQAKRDLHKAGFVRTPLEIYLKNADWKRDPNARRRRQPAKARRLHAREARVAGQARERRRDGRPGVFAEVAPVSSRSTTRGAPRTRGGRAGER
jgi:ABC-type nitrate/sulfonate/bicarbonate transport system substrate-binding protein